jgi:S-adenosyl-L-methionine hydrolase (adenosine-forming)
VTGRFDTVSFLSDFGHGDEFVGVVHSVVRSIAPHVAVIDVTHGIAPHDVRAGGLALARAANYLCPGVVIAVVDPGVGTQRRPIALEVGNGASYLIGPDNGLLAPAVGLVGGATRAVELTSPDHRIPSAAGSTFDGRDIFAPAAAHLCNGVPLTDLGPEVDPAGLIPGVLPVSRLENGVLLGEVLWVDRFGNCQLNVDPLELEEFGDQLAVTISGDDRVAVRADAYDHIPTGRVGLLVDSSGLLSIAVARSSAAAELGLHEGDEVRITSLDGEAAPGVVTPVELGRRLAQ